MQITFGVTTYNRLDDVKTLQRCLAAQSWPDGGHLRIYDDCSSAYDLAFLEQTFSFARTIVRRHKNMGADNNIRQMFVDFLKTGDDVLLAVDSDMIVNPAWHACLEKVFPESDGVLSLYNSNRHPGSSAQAISEYPMVQKEHMGSAGAALSREVVQEIIENVPASRSYDWDWCKHLRRQGRRLLCVQHSHAQHLGMDGTNAGLSTEVDFGIGFDPGNEVNTKILLEFYEQVMLRLNRQFAHNLRNSTSWRVGRVVTAPARWAVDTFTKTR